MRKPNPETVTIGKTSFGNYCAINKPFFAVKSGVPIEEALEHASCLMGCIRDLTVIDSVDSDAGMRAWSAHYLSEMAKALIDDVVSAMHEKESHS